jgi:hypothetical protein
MRAVVLGFLVVAGLVIGVAAGAPERHEGGAQRVPPHELQSTLANADMIAVSANVGDKYQQLTVIDPKLRVMSVYTSSSPPAGLPCGASATFTSTCR